MKSRTITLISLVGLSIGVAAATLPLAGLGYQQGVPSQPGTPSTQPGPKNPTPGPQNPQPGPTTTPSTPGQTQPGTKLPPDANNPNPNNPNQPANPNNPGVPAGALPNGVNPVNGNSRYGRPFAFQSPEVEARFTDNARKLNQMEQRMDRGNQDLMRKLGEARSLTGERQSTALFDIVQQMLRDRTELQQYLVQSRTSWTGEMDFPENTPLPAGNTPGTAPTKSIQR